MSASTRAVQQPLGTRTMGPVLVAIALVIVLAAAAAFGQLAATKSQTAPAAGAAPVYNNYHWSGYTEAAAAAAKAAGSTSIYNDYSWSGYTEAAAAAAARAAGQLIGTGAADPNSYSGPRARSQ
jgi:ABC-type sugar transport system substrate-binding protein